MPPVDLDALTLAAVRGGALAGVPVTVLGLARTGVGLARFLADAGAIVTVYDGKPEAALADRIAELDGRPIRLLAGPDVDPASTWAGRRARRLLSVDHARLPDHGAAPPGRPRRPRRPTSATATRGRPRSSPSPT